MRFRTLLVLIAVGVLGLASAVAVAAAVSTGTVSACATATQPPHTLALDGGAVATLPGTSTASCTTQTYTIPTVTTTATQTVTQTVTTTVTQPPPPPPPSTTVAPPIPPGSYAVPSGTTVSTAAGLTSALASGTKTIILADGTYGSASYFNDWNGSSLYALHPRAAVLTAGLMVGGNGSTSGATIRGLAFNVTNAAATFQSSELNIWGSAGVATSALDCSFEGNWKVGVGLLAYSSTGLTAQRDTFSDFTDEGIRASYNTSDPYETAGVPTITSISDISVNGVSRSTPGASGGTAEAGIWVGEPVTQGVHRIKVRNVSISGIETVADSWDTTFTDLDIDMSGPHSYAGVGVYLEHFSLGDTFTNFSLTGVHTGFNAEWDDGILGNEAAQNDVIEDGVISADGWTLSPQATAGVYLDEGTGSTTISGVTFIDQTWAAIGEYLNSGVDTVSGNTYQLASTAIPVSTGHIP
jgi:hypothetical protein